MRNKPTVLRQKATNRLYHVTKKNRVYLSKKIRNVSSGINYPGLLHVHIETFPIGKIMYVKNKNKQAKRKE